VVSHVRELAGYPFQLTLVNPFSFLFSYISPTYYHAADDSLGTFPGGAVSQAWSYATLMYVGAGLTLLGSLAARGLKVHKEKNWRSCH
jgi:hypothetical protein